jgi:hypothetical protein
VTSSSRRSDARLRRLGDVLLVHGIGGDWDAVADGLIHVRVVGPIKQKKLRTFAKHLKKNLPRSS